MLWDGYGELVIGKVLRSKVEIAGMYKRADILTRATWRDRNRAERGLPSLGWTGNGAVAGLYEALTYVYVLPRGDHIIESTLDPLEHVTKPDRDDSGRRSPNPRS